MAGICHGFQGGASMDRMGTGTARIAAVLLAGVLAGCATPSGSGSGSASERREALRKLRDTTLQDFYATNPAIREEVAGAVGYAVFDGSQVNVLLYVGANGAGVLMDNATQKETFMTMARVGTGPGVGYKSYRQLMVFKDRALFDTFSTVGADVGASADATFKASGTKGLTLDGSTSFNPHLSVYQITDSGALLQANWGGVAYLPDGELNAK
jgi:lipid-binding SYLF domain-containing protein